MVFRLTLACYPFDQFSSDIELPLVFLKLSKFQSGCSCFYLWPWRVEFVLLPIWVHVSIMWFKYTFPYDGNILGASTFSIYIFFEVAFAYLNICFYTCNSWEESPHGAQEEVLQIASKLGIGITVGLAHQSSISGKGLDDHLKHVDGDVSVYLGASPIVECLERYKPNVIITSRVADASLFLGPMVYELGWNWDELQLLAQGSLAGHLLECGCQLTGGYYMHPADKYRSMSFQDLLDLSLPFAEVTFDGTVHVAKAEATAGVLNFSTCSEQLLYEVGDPGAYITPDVIIDIRDVSFQPLSKSKVHCSGAKPSSEPLPQKMLVLSSKDCGWKGWGEISYGGYESVKRAKAAEFLVRAWMEEMYPGTSKRILSYIIGFDSLKAVSTDNKLPRTSEDIRLRMDGLFEQEKHAIQFIKEFTALYTNGPAGGGGISTGHKKEIYLEKGLVGREYVYWQIAAARNNVISSIDQNVDSKIKIQTGTYHESDSQPVSRETTYSLSKELLVPESHLSPAPAPAPAPARQKISLYDVAHSRAGDKGNDLNFSIIPHFPPDIERLKTIVTPEWVREAVSTLLNLSSFPDSSDIERRDEWASEHLKVEIYEVRGIHSLNIVVRDILDGGVNCSRRIDRHGKTISDVILCQKVVLPP
ncbi:uncharacterized protein LOC111390006 isoform X2 [Olea europaea var. sylvestris]|uniref:uncharacterized protein LOC111390006 isoform X2 n=1 Tax=Olea europaea var. sylvestris TaxID=158386 RepID=UPI000C1D5400|nr:uncharacterized protein LOC111390006 isoform X2 [Olea europaea var. sylvestris]